MLSFSSHLSRAHSCEDCAVLEGTAESICVPITGWAVFPVSEDLRGLRAVKGLCPPSRGSQQRPPLTLTLPAPGALVTDCLRRPSPVVSGGGKCSRIVDRTGTRRAHLRALQKLPALFF